MADGSSPLSMERKARSRRAHGDSSAVRDCCHASARPSSRRRGTRMTPRWYHASQCVLRPSLISAFEQGAPLGLDHRARRVLGGRAVRKFAGVEQREPGFLIVAERVVGEGERRRGEGVLAGAAATTGLERAPAGAVVEELAAAAMGEGVGAREVDIEPVLREAAVQLGFDRLVCGRQSLPWTFTGSASIRP